MAKKIDEGTQITLDLKTIGILLFFVATVVGMWFSLKASIDEAKNYPYLQTQKLLGWSLI